MSTDYIICELSNNNNSFDCEFKCNLLRYNYPNSIKLDTGAEFTLLSMPRLGLEENVCLESKEKLLRDNRYIYTIMNGVETTYSNITREEFMSWSLEQKMNCKGICIFIRVKDIVVNSYSFNKEAGIFVTFDNNSNNLLGMDILKHFDFHIGVSRVTGKSTFIGCLKDRINSEYLDALYQHFGYLSEDACKEICQQVQTQTYLNAVQQAYRAGSWRDYIDKQKKLTALQNKIKRNGEVIR